MQIDIERSYDLAGLPKKHPRFLVDRLWPRGLSKDSLLLDGWAKEISPSDDLRKWYHKKPGEWAAFQDRYRKELDANADAVARFLLQIKGHTAITLVYSSAERQHNNAAVLRTYLLKALDHS